MNLLWWVTLLPLVKNGQSEKRIMRYRRQVLDLDTLPDVKTQHNSYGQRGLHYVNRSKGDGMKRYRKKGMSRSGRKMRSGKGRKKGCDTGDYWSDLLYCDRGDFSFSMPNFPSPFVPSPSSDFVPISVPLPSQSYVPIPTILIPTPPIAPSVLISAPTTAPFANCRALGRSNAIIAAVEALAPNADERQTEPVGRALDFLLFDDLQFDPCVSTDTLAQRYLMAILYYSAGGDDWTNSQGWLSSASECTWTGVACDSEGKIVGLSLGS